MNKGKHDVKKSKSFDGNPFVVGVPSDSDYELIKSFMPSGDIPKEEIFVYRVKLCDNNVDRDFEVFSHQALKDVADKFVGVVGIKNHIADSDYNHSRIYKTELVVDSNRKSDFGDPYTCVLGYAYTLNNEANRQLIDEIKAGIKKEVSIGFECGSMSCSIDHSSFCDCGHWEGREYEIDGKMELCLGIIDSVTDAYEWSFVSIPAQREAGIVKQYNTNKKGVTKMTLKELSLEIAPKLDSDLAVKFMSAVDEACRPESETIKSLTKRVKELEDEVAAKEETIADMEKKEHDRLIGEAIEHLFEELKPANDTMRDLAYKEIEDLVKIGDDGEVEGIEEARAKLCGEEYAPMFQSSKEPDDPDATKSNEGLTDEAKQYLKGLSKKSFDFTRVSNFKSPDKLFSNKSHGIETVSK